MRDPMLIVKTRKNNGIYSAPVCFFKEEIFCF